MKGRILDFKKDKLGLSLVENLEGKDYIFFFEKEWKKKNIKPKIGMNVEFEISGSVAKNIYPSSEEIEKHDNKKIEKINFETYKTMLDSDLYKRYEKRKKLSLKSNFVLRFIPSIFFFGLGIVFFNSGWYYEELGLVFIILGLIWPLMKAFKLTSKELENYKEEFMVKLYNGDVSIIYDIPETLNYKNIEMIFSDGENHSQCEFNLIKDAYKLEDDAIININYNSTGSSYHAQGMAIKIN